MESVVEVDSAFGEEVGEHLFGHVAERASAAPCSHPPRACSLAPPDTAQSRLLERKPSLDAPLWPSLPRRPLPTRADGPGTGAPAGGSTCRDRRPAEWRYPGSVS